MEARPSTLAHKQRPWDKQELALLGPPTVPDRRQYLRIVCEHLELLPTTLFGKIFHDNKTKM
jgi:hypothetical protein